jgi:hypothetical protein
VADKLEVKLLHPVASLALAGCGLLYVAEPLSEGEVCRFDCVLKQRTFELVTDRVEEGRVALEFGEPERWAKTSHNRVHQIGNDVLRVIEFDTGEKAGVAGNIRDQETGGFGFRKH